MLRPTLGFAIVLAAALLVNSIRLPQRAYAVDLPEGYNEKSESRKPSALDNLRTIATNVNHQRTEFYRRGDLKGATSMYTADATYVELLPPMTVMKGYAQIKGHLRELMEAKASDIVATVTTVGMRGPVMVVGGDYYLLVDNDKKVSGHFFQELRKENDIWKIHLHIFARSEPVTTIESQQYHTGG